jgi:hypothetical protein
MPQLTPVTTAKIRIPASGVPGSRSLTTIAHETTARAHSAAASHQLKK